MRLYTGKILQIYEYKELPIDKYVIEQLKKLSTDEKCPLVQYKYKMFEWAPGIFILDVTQEEALDIIYEYELDVEDVTINDDDNGLE